jgi:hypothetical protein
MSRKWVAFLMSHTRDTGPVPGSVAIGKVDKLGSMLFVYTFLMWNAAYDRTGNKF